MMSRKVDGIIPIGLDVTDQDEVYAALEADRLLIRAISTRWSTTRASTAIRRCCGLRPRPRTRGPGGQQRSAPWRLIEAFLPLLHRSSQPRIVNVSSGAGQLSDMNGGRAAYRVSKAALNALTRTLAWDEDDVKVNAMCPGWVRTDMGGSGAARSVEEGADTAVWLATLPMTARPEASSRSQANTLVRWLRPRI